jgi:hypothetical protein
MSRKMAIGKSYRLKAGKLVPCFKHLPVNLRLLKQASQRVRARKSIKSGQVRL